jgi:hypothetical protein
MLKAALQRLCAGWNPGWLMVLLCFEARAYPPLESSDFNLEYYEGTVAGSPRIIGMGGAYGAVAEGVAGFPFNPASLAKKSPHNKDWWDYDLALDWLIPGSRVNMDIDNTGWKGLGGGSLSFVEGGLSAQLGRVGLGLFLRGREYPRDLSEPTLVRRYVFSLFEVDLGLGVEVIKETLVIGGGFATTGMDVKKWVEGSDKYETLMGFQSGFWRLGALWMIPNSPWSFGAAFAYPAQSSKTKGSAEAVADFLLPKAVLRPWELSLSTAYRHDMNAHEHDRRYIRGSLDVRLLGASADAVTMPGFLYQVRQAAGEKPSVAVHLGGESEIIGNLLVVRTGTYLEPSRASSINPRMHFTAGSEIRLFKLVWVWKASLAFDVAARYSNVCLGIGFWH